MSERNDGGAAFPTEQGHTPEGLWNQTYDPGATLREYFAAKAMQGFCANPHHGAIDFNPEWEGYDGGIPEEFQQAAREAYLMADAMLKAREESK